MLVIVVMVMVLIVMVVVMVAMVMVMSVGGRDGGSGGTPHRENVPTHPAGLLGGADPTLGQQPPRLDWIGLVWIRVDLSKWIGLEQLRRSTGLNLL